MIIHDKLGKWLVYDKPDTFFPEHYYVKFTNGCVVYDTYRLTPAYEIGILYEHDLVEDTWLNERYGGVIAGLNPDEVLEMLECISKLHGQGKGKTMKNKLKNYAAILTGKDKRRVWTWDKW